jgi:hypothetical protein
METIKIPKRFQEGLRKKFDVNNFSKLSKSTSFINTCDCLLCSKYKDELNCTQCPFRGLGSGIRAGCINFVQKAAQELDIRCYILLTQKAVFTDDLEDFSKIVEYAAGFIEFVEEDIYQQ